MERFFRRTKPVGSEVPRGAPPGGEWREEFETVQGTIKSHRRSKGYRYIVPDIGGPAPFEGVTGLYPSRESIPVISVADADARRETERESKGLE